ncbi:hypothetical protein OE88DRAFT_1661127 [Heliocybe sulcata]|uniref:Uncharacterized protein n=1 Tax=Heliocybe sulcata TaxID=5364 RepID=A0A5C3N9U9_9AGAM|nr:hypothetical protein OE88DRAFT_1661127 [Heliocybe sulcata]
MYKCMDSVLQAEGRNRQYDQGRYRVKVTVRDFVPCRYPQTVHFEGDPQERQPRSVTRPHRRSLSGGSIRDQIPTVHLVRYRVLL